jgi:hypothetical protein
LATVETRALTKRFPGAWIEGTRLDLFAIAAIGVHIGLALALRVSAWPEVTTPAYLCSRGMLLYRDIKFVHTPGTITTLALAFLAFGVQTWVVRVYAMVWPLIAHLFILRYTRRFTWSERALASLFFLTFFFSIEGSAVWPTVVLSAFSLPVAAALSRGRMLRAGLLIGVAILFKQTVGYLLVVATLALLAGRRWRDAGELFLSSSLPYWITIAIFATLGAGADALRWTIEVPVTVLHGIFWFRPSRYEMSVLLFAFLPTIVDAVLERADDEGPRSRWLLIVALGLAAMSYPRFGIANVGSAVPCLAVGAARFVRRLSSLRWPRARAYGYGLVVTYAVSRGLILFTNREFDGKVLFWNDTPALDALALRLRRFPPETPLYSPLWENILPRSGLLPPGRIYVNPYFDYLFPVDDVGNRVRAASRRPGVIVVDYRRSRSDGEVVGPFVIRRMQPTE